MSSHKRFLLILSFLIPCSLFTGSVEQPLEQAKTNYYVSGINIILNLALVGQKALALTGDFQKEHFGTDIFSLSGEQELAPAHVRNMVQEIGKLYAIPYLIPVYILKNNYALRMSPGIVATNGAIYIASNDLFALQQNMPVNSLAVFLIHDAVLQLHQSFFTKRILSSLGLGFGCFALCNHYVDKSVYGSLALLGFNSLTAQAGLVGCAVQIPISLFCGVVASTASSLLSQSIWSVYADYAVRQRASSLRNIDKSEVKIQLEAFIKQLNPHDIRKPMFENYLTGL